MALYQYFLKFDTSKRILEILKFYLYNFYMILFNIFCYCIIFLGFCAKFIKIISKISNYFQQYKHQNYNKDIFKPIKKVH